MHVSFAVSRCPLKGHGAPAAHLCDGGGPNKDGERFEREKVHHSSWITLEYNESNDFMVNYDGFCKN